MQCVFVLLATVGALAASSGASRQKRHCAQVAIPANVTFEEKVRHLKTLGIQVEEDEQLVAFREFSGIVFKFQLPSEDDLQPFKVSKLVGLCTGGAADVENATENANETTIRMDLCDLYRAVGPFSEAAKKYLKLPLASAFKVPGVHHLNRSAPTCDDLSGPFITSNFTPANNLYNTYVNKLATCSQDSLNAFEVSIPWTAPPDLREVYKAFADQFQNSTFDVVDNLTAWKMYSIGAPIFDVLLKTLDVWTYTQAAAEVQRWKEAAAACSQSKLPTSLISNQLWDAELENLKSRMSNSTELVLETGLYEAYQDSRLVACAMYNNSLVVRAVVPVKTGNETWKAVGIWTDARSQARQANTSCSLEKVIQKTTFAIGASDVVEVVDNKDLIVKVPGDSIVRDKCAYNILKQLYSETGDDYRHGHLCRICKLNCE